MSNDIKIKSDKMSWTNNSSRDGHCCWCNAFCDSSCDRVINEGGMTYIYRVCLECSYAPQPNPDPCSKCPNGVCGECARKHNRYMRTCLNNRYAPFMAFAENGVFRVTPLWETETDLKIKLDGDTHVGRIFKHEKSPHAFGDCQIKKEDGIWKILVTLDGSDSTKFVPIGTIVQMNPEKLVDLKGTKFPLGFVAKPNTLSDLLTDTVRKEEFAELCRLYH